MENAIEQYRASSDDGEDREALIKMVAENISVCDKIRHLLTAYDTIYKAACDPKLPYLEYRRDFKEFLDNKEAGRNGYTDFPENAKQHAWLLLNALNNTYAFDKPEGKYHALCQNDFIFPTGDKVCLTVEVDHYEQ